MGREKTPSNHGTIDQAAPHVRRSNPHLLSRHRIHHTTSSILWSLFEWHNETINIWSHLIPAGLFLHRLYQVLVTVDREATDHLLFSLYLASCCLLCTFSAVYHLFTSHSERVHNLVVKFDFLGILLVIMSSFAIGIWYGFKCQPHLRNAYLITLMLIDSTMLITPFLQIKVQIRRLIFVFAVAIGVIPLAHMILLLGYNDCVHHIGVLLALYLFAFLFYITKFPEKYFPYSFDLLFASHQLWHLILDVAFVYFYLSMEGVYNSMKEMPCNM